MSEDQPELKPAARLAICVIFLSALSISVVDHFVDVAESIALLAFGVQMFTGALAIAPLLNIWAIKGRYS